jgi:hypothetical protein
MPHFHANSKLIVVEENLGAQKVHKNSSGMPRTKKSIVEKKKLCGVNFCTITFFTFFRLALFPFLSSSFLLCRALKGGRTETFEKVEIKKFKNVKK